jgi:TfoX/Sxy family transcriptional regulator of competence genes
MGYNLDLEDRIDCLLCSLGQISKRKMFGGIGYLVNGNMCFGIHREALVLRLSPDQAEEFLRSEYVTPFDITGKPMKGWILVSPDLVENPEQLLDMLRLGFDFAKKLAQK